MSKTMTQDEFCERIKNYTNDSVEVIGKYINKRTKVKIRCKKCNFEWDFSPTNLAPSNIKRSSFNGCPECKYETINCSYCGKKFKRLKSIIVKNQSGYIYCSKECGNRHKNELIQNNINSTSYRRNAFLNYEHKCAICGWSEDERILEVHHIDENRNNNNVNNLIILCPICHKKLTLHLYTLDELNY